MVSSIKVLQESEILFDSVDLISLIFKLHLIVVKSSHVHEWMPSSC